MRGKVRLVVARVCEIESVSKLLPELLQFFHVSRLADRDNVFMRSKK